MVMELVVSVVNLVCSRKFHAALSALMMVAAMLFGARTASADEVWFQSYQRASESEACVAQTGETPWKISSCQDRTPHSLLASLTGECVYMVVSGVKGTGSPAMPAAIEHAVHETRRGRRQCVSSLGARRARARGCARTGSRKARHRLTEQPLPLIAAWPPARPPRCRTGHRGAPRRRVFPRRATPRRRQRLAARGAVVGAGS